MENPVCQSAIAPPGGVEPHGGWRFRDDRVMADCHRRAWTVTAGARPEAGSLDGPTMSKSELGPIIAQMGWGRIAEDGSEISGFGVE